MNRILLQNVRGGPFRGENFTFEHGLFHVLSGGSESTRASLLVDVVCAAARQGLALATANRRGATVAGTSTGTDEQFKKTRSGSLLDVFPSAKLPVTCELISGLLPPAPLGSLSLGPASNGTIGELVGYNEAIRVLAERDGSFICPHDNQELRGTSLAAVLQSLSTKRVISGGATTEFRGQSVFAVCLPIPHGPSLLTELEAFRNSGFSRILRAGRVMRLENLAVGELGTDSLQLIVGTVGLSYAPLENRVLSSESREGTVANSAVGLMEVGLPVIGFEVNSQVAQELGELVVEAFQQGANFRGGTAQVVIEEIREGEERFREIVAPGLLCPNCDFHLETPSRAIAELFEKVNLNSGAKQKSFKLYGSRISDWLRMTPNSLISSTEAAFRQLGVIQPKKLRGKESKSEGQKNSDFERGQALFRAIEGRLEALVRFDLGGLALDTPCAGLSPGQWLKLQCACFDAERTSDTLFLLANEGRGLHSSDLASVLSWARNACSRGNTVIWSDSTADVLALADKVCLLEDESGANQELRRSTTSSSFSSEGDAYGSSTRENRTPDSDVGRGEANIFDDRIQERGACPRRVVEIVDPNGEQIKLEVGTIIGVTGVAGSGKSRWLAKLSQSKKFSKILSVSDPRLASVLANRRTKRISPLLVEELGIGEQLSSVFAETPSARQHSLEPLDFRVGKGKFSCAKCSGRGVEREQSFFGGLNERICGRCLGQRFLSPVSEVRVNGKTVSDVLASSIDEARLIVGRNRTLVELLDHFSVCGLGRLSLGCPLSQLSLGELAKFMVGKATAELLAEVKKKSKPGKAGERGTLFLVDTALDYLEGEVRDSLFKIFSRLSRVGVLIVIAANDRDIIAACDSVQNLSISSSA